MINEWVVALPFQRFVREFMKETKSTLLRFIIIILDWDDLPIRLCISEIDGVFVYIIHERHRYILAVTVQLAPTHARARTNRSTGRTGNDQIFWILRRRLWLADGLWMRFGDPRNDSCPTGRPRLNDIVNIKIMQIAWPTWLCGVCVRNTY